MEKKERELMCIFYSCFHCAIVPKTDEKQKQEKKRILMCPCVTNVNVYIICDSNQLCNAIFKLSFHYHRIYRILMIDRWRWLHPLHIIPIPSSEKCLQPLATRIQEERKRMACKFTMSHLLSGCVQLVRSHIQFS